MKIELLPFPRGNITPSRAASQLALFLHYNIIIILYTIYSKISIGNNYYTLIHQSIELVELTNLNGESKQEGCYCNLFSFSRGHRLKINKSNLGNTSKSVEYINPVS